MARFGGTPVEETRKPRFGGQPVGEAPQKSFWQKLRETVEPHFNELTDLQNASDVMRVGVNSVGLGLPDYLGGSDQEKLTAEARARLGGGAMPLEVGAGFFTPTGVPAKIGRGLQTIGHGISGGAQSVIDAYTHGERDLGDLGMAGLTGSGLSAAGSAIADPVASWWNRRTNAVAAPKSKDLGAKADEGYEAVRKAGGVYQSRDLKKLAAEIINMPLSPGIDDRAIALRKRLLNDWKGKDISPDEFDKLQQWVRKKMKTADPSVRATGEEFVNMQRNFADKTKVVVPPKSGIGPPSPGPEVNETLKGARADYAKSKQLEAVEKVTDAPNKSKGSILSQHKEADEGPMRDRMTKVIKKENLKGPAEEAGQRVAQGTLARDIGDIGRSINPITGGLPAKLLSGFTLGTSFLPQVGIGGALSEIGRRAKNVDVGDLKHVIATGSKATADPAVVAQAKDRLARLLSTGSRSINRGYEPDPTGSFLRHRGPR